MNFALEEIKKLVEGYAIKINVPKNLLPTYGNWTECHPNVEVDKNGQLRYEFYERGEQIKNEFAWDEDDLCYRIFEDITFIMASDFELNHRARNQDSRRVLFKKQEELLGELKEAWKERKAKEHQDILNIAPFND
jgi:hypothetical protein